MSIASRRCLEDASLFLEDAVYDLNRAIAAFEEGGDEKARIRAYKLFDEASEMLLLTNALLDEGARD